jgi:hypothetical protein
VDSQGLSRADRSHILYNSYILNRPHPFEVEKSKNYEHLGISKLEGVFFENQNTEYQLL